MASTKFKIENPVKHDVSLEELDTMLGETLARIYEKYDNYDKKIADAKLEGKKEGKLENAKEIAMNMIKIGLNFDIISSVTKIPLSDLKKIASANSINKEKAQSFLFNLCTRVKNIMRSIVK